MQQRLLACSGIATALEAFARTGAAARSRAALQAVAGFSDDHRGRHCHCCRRRHHSFVFLYTFQRLGWLGPFFSCFSTVVTAATTTAATTTTTAEGNLLKTNAIQ
jgi:hypothetical protein